MEGRFKSCLLANVNVDGKRLRQIAKINIKQRLPIVHCGNNVLAFVLAGGRPPAGEEWGKVKKTGSRNVGKENDGCFSCSYEYDRAGRAGKLFVFLYSVKGIWLIF